MTSYMFPTPADWTMRRDWGVDNTVSVVDIATFKETDKIIVGPNPGKIIADTKEKVVYVATRGEDVESRRL